MKTAPRSSIDLRNLDLGSLALFVGYALSDAVLAELHKQGHDALRVSHGFVFQHLIEEERTVGELAERLGVTQQAASKSVLELETLGYLERVGDPADGRIRRVRLTKRGWSAIESARAGRVRLAARLAKHVGTRRLDAARKVLAEVLELSGGADAVRARRVRAPG